MKKVAKKVVKKVAKKRIVKKVKVAYRAYPPPIFEDEEAEAESILTGSLSAKLLAKGLRDLIELGNELEQTLELIEFEANCRAARKRGIHIYPSRALYPR